MPHRDENCFAKTRDRNRRLRAAVTSCLLTTRSTLAANTRPVEGSRTEKRHTSPDETRRSCELATDQPARGQCTNPSARGE